MTHALPPASTPAPVPDAVRVPIPLRLVAFRGGLGVELYQPQRFGPVQIEELTWSLPGVAFPVDLSGGVRSFSRKRGLLQRVVLSVGLSDLEQWLSKRCDDAPSLGALQRPVSVWPVEHGLGVGVCARDGSLGFDLLWAPEGDKAQFVVNNPRFVASAADPPLPYVLGFLSHVLGRLARCEGRKLTFGSVAQSVVRELLPGLGFRLPNTQGLCCSALELRAEHLTVTMDRTLPHWAAPPEVAGAMEFARTALAGDAALTAGSVDAARRAYIVALEFAPRHSELSQIIASIDAQYEERAESALGLLVESLPAVEFGLVGARLLAKTGDFDGARLAVAKLAALERFAPLAAGYWLALSRWLPEFDGQLEAIELALAASNAFLPARWARFAARVRVGDVNGAVADAEHLEAASLGSDARHAVLVQAAGELADAGFIEAAGRLYERSLRYSPSDPRSSMGVALGLINAGKQQRALVLLQRAVELAQDDEAVRSEANLALARLLADYVGDLPQAINRARQVTGSSVTVVDARGHEAVWRAKIGDLAGASVAFSRLVDTINASSGTLPFQAAHWLVEAGQFFSQQCGDYLAAERSLAHALRLMPKDVTIAEAYRVVARHVHALQRPDVESHDSAATSSAPDELVASEHGQPERLSVLSDEEIERDLELEVESLKAQLLASRSPLPETIDALVNGLHQLGRDEEAYALLQAQVDDATGPSKANLQQALRKVLGSLIDAARDAGEADDVELYELALSRL